MQKTDAHALHALLKRVRASSKPSLETAWAEALDCSPNSYEFARRHAETVTLLNSTLAQIAAMPDQAEYGERSTLAWWQMVISPNTAWNNNSQKPAQLINQTQLDYLGTVANLLGATRTRKSDEDAVPKALDDLAVECKQWLDELDGFPEVPDSLLTVLRHDLEHVIWLIEHAELFGMERVAAAGKQAVAQAFVVGTEVAAEKRAGWWHRAGGVLSKIALVMNVVNGTVLGIQTGTDAATAIQHLVGQ